MRVLLTGGTGFLGEYLLAELLDRGHSVWALYRHASKKLDTIRFLDELGLPKSARALRWLKGEVLDADKLWDQWRGADDEIEQVDTLLHAAGSTRLHMDRLGEPLKTNLGGAKALRALVARKPMQAHIISTAYVCGLVQSANVAEVNHPRGDFVNVYEESKWEAEQVWRGEATILRPSIIVGHSKNGRCSSFAGWYILFQALYLLNRLLALDSSIDRYDTGLHVPVDPMGTANIIPVDYVSRAVVALIENPANHNRIFHLTNPDPPTHEWTLDLVCRRFNIGGISLTGADTPFSRPRNRIESMVWKQLRTIAQHFANNPLFDRTETDKAIPHVAVPKVTREMVDTLLDYAVKHDWGQAKS